jgi:hypothetical protein
VKLSSDLIQALITFVVGGGFAALISQGTKAIRDLRGGARATTRAVIRDLADDRKEAEERLEHMTRVAEYWRAVAGNYNFQLRSNGVEPDPANPIPPEAAARADARARRKVKELEDTLTGMNLDDE